MSSSRADTWSRLHADLTPNHPAMVDLLVDHGRTPILVLQTGSDGLADALRSELGKDVWSTDTFPYPANWRRKRFVCGDLRWVHKHPQLRHAVADGFAAIMAAAPVWPAFGSAVEISSALAELHKWLQPGGVLQLLEPAAAASSQPELVTHSGVRFVRQQLDGQRHEVRAVPGCAPVIAAGPNLDAAGWEEVLRNGGFTRVTSETLQHGYVLLSGARPVP